MRWMPFVDIRTADVYIHLLCCLPLDEMKREEEKMANKSWNVKWQKGKNFRFIGLDYKNHFQNHIQLQFFGLHALSALFHLSLVENVKSLPNKFEC